MGTARRPCFAALDVATGEVIHECLPRPRHQEFLRFLPSVGTASFFAYIAGDDALW